MTSFIDIVEISVRAGDGGDGCVSFRRLRNIPRGGPDGGDGGKGGDIIIRVEPQMRTLLDLRYRRNYKAPKGCQGEGARKSGHGGDDVIIKVPPGTIIQDANSGRTLADLISADQEIVIARGGDGGTGNFSFRSATDQAPTKATLGREGEKLDLRLTLKLIADVGLVGLPNAGKSTLLSAVSQARPLIADYPFSTLTPNLAIVRVDEAASFCMVDIPGLIEGAHQGKGLGLQFLQHVERCRVLLIILEVGGEVSARDAYRQLLHELESYSPILLKTPRIVALNKIDIIHDWQQFDSDLLPQDVELHRISAASGEGLASMMQLLFKKVLESFADEKEPDEIPPYDPLSM